MKGLISIAAMLNCVFDRDKFVHALVSGGSAPVTRSFHWPDSWIILTMG